MKKWSSIVESKRNEVIECMVEAYKSTEGTMQGWQVHIELDENDVWVTGLMSQNSQSGSSFNGDSYIFHVQSSWELDYNVEEALEAEYPEIYAQFDGYDINKFMREHKDILEELSQNEFEAQISNFKDIVDDIFDSNLELIKQMELTHN